MLALKLNITVDRRWKAFIDTERTQTELRVWVTLRWSWWSLHPYTPVTSVKPVSKTWFKPIFNSILYIICTPFLWFLFAYSVIRLLKPHKREKPFLIRKLISSEERLSLRTGMNTSNKLNGLKTQQSSWNLFESVRDCTRKCVFESNIVAKKRMFLLFPRLLNIFQFAFIVDVTQLVALWSNLRNLLDFFSRTFAVAHFFICWMKTAIKTPHSG